MILSCRLETQINSATLVKHSIQGEFFSVILSTCFNTYALPMTDNNKTNMASEEELKRLSHQINELIAACNALKSENTQLKAQQTSFNDEKSKWVDYQNEVKARVQLMVQRLKTLEQSS